jgi:hypothetical protein
MNAGSLIFTATKSGDYQYLWPVPGNARDGTIGAFSVR